MLICTRAAAIGRDVLIVNGRFRGERGKLVSLQADKFSATIRLTSGLHRDEVVSGIEFEDFCKVA